MSIKTIGLVVAMELEAAPIIEALKLAQIRQELNIKVYSNRSRTIYLAIEDKCLDYGIDNIGTNSAVLNTHILIQDYEPDIVINAGTAGGFKSQKGEIGDVYFVSDFFIFHDRRITIPNYEDYALGKYPCFDTSELRKSLNLKKGILSTGNSLDYTRSEWKIMQDFNVSLKDMEGAAIAWVCRKHHQPYIAIKAITDIVDGDIATEVAFERNLKLACSNLAGKVKQLIDLLHSETDIVLQYQ